MAAPLAREVSQIRLARIKQHQCNIALEQQELSAEWETIREDLKKGAKIEKGPMHAWLEQEVFMSGSGKVEKTRMRMRVT